MKRALRRSFSLRRKQSIVWFGGEPDFAADICARMCDKRRHHRFCNRRSCLRFVEQPLSKRLYWLSAQSDGLGEDEAEGFGNGFSLWPRGHQIAQRGSRLLGVLKPSFRVLSSVQARQFLQCGLSFASCQKFRMANRNQHFMQQRVSPHSRPRWVLEMDSGIKSASGQDEGVHALGKMHSDVRMLLLKS